MSFFKGEKAAESPPSHTMELDQWQSNNSNHIRKAQSLVRIGSGRLTFPEIPQASFTNDRRQGCPHTGTEDQMRCLVCSCPKFRLLWHQLSDPDFYVAGIRFRQRPHSSYVSWWGQESQTPNKCGTATAREYGHWKHQSFQEEISELGSWNSTGKRMEGVTDAPRTAPSVVSEQADFLLWTHSLQCPRHLHFSSQFFFWEENSF